MGEFHIWTLIESWTRHTDKVLGDLADRLLSRRIFKTIDVDTTQHKNLNKLLEHAKSLTKKSFPYLDDHTVEYYVCLDEPSRTSYKRYDWRSESTDESIWLVGDGRKPRALENDEQSKIVAALKDTKYFHRLIFPAEIRSSLRNDMEEIIKKLQEGKG